MIPQKSAEIESLSVSQHLHGSWRQSRRSTGSNLFGVGKLPLSGLEDDAGELVWCAKWRIASPAPRCYCFS